MQDPVIARRFAFESHRFDAATHELHGPGYSIKLRPQASTALALLLSRRGDVVTKEELRDALWPDHRVVMFEGSIAAVIRELRRALGDNPRAPEFIDTIAKRGYRFIPACEEAANTAPRAGRTSRSRPAVAGVVRLLQGLTVAAVLLLPGSGDHGMALQSPETRPVTIAVLPFEDLAQLPAPGLLAQTVAHDLVGWLGPAMPERLRIVENPPPDHPADFVIRGSVRDDADAVVITARLLAGADGGFVWGDDYRRNPADASLASREVAARIAEQVLSAAMPRWRRDADAVPANPAAAAAWRRGMQGLALLSREGTADAAKAFKEVTRLAPDSPNGHARLAQALIRWPGPPVTPDRAEQARRAAERALALDTDNAMAHRVLGDIHLFLDRDWPRAGRRLERAVELAPAAASAHHSYAGWLSARGRHGEAFREIDLAEALDPSSVLISIDAMLMHFYARDFEGTIRAARRLEQLWPETGSARRYLILSRLMTGDVAGAADEARSVIAESAAGSDTAQSGPGLTDAAALDRYWAATLRGISRYVQEHAGDPTVLALVHVQMGQLDAAIDELERAMSGPRFSYFLPYLGVSPAFDSLCGDPRFERILRKLGQTALGSNSVQSRCDDVIRASIKRSDAG